MSGQLGRWRGVEVAARPPTIRLRRTELQESGLPPGTVRLVGDGGGRVIGAAAPVRESARASVTGGRSLLPSGGSTPRAAASSGRRRHPDTPVGKAVALFEQLWPRYAGDEQLVVRIQEGLTEIAASIHWDQVLAAWQVTLCPSGDAVRDLEAMLHEAVHVREGHAPRLPEPPSWVRDDGTLDEAALLRVLHARRERGDGATAMVALREHEAERLAKAELARLGL